MLMNNKSERRFDERLIESLQKYQQDSRAAPSLVNSNRVASASKEVFSVANTGIINLDDENYNETLLKVQMPKNMNI